MSSAVIDARGVTVTHEPRTVLDAVDVRVGPDSRIALIGPNGSGKSTLLRVLAGTEPSWSGSVYRNGEIGYLPQMAGHQGTETAREVILERIGVAAASREVDRLAALLAGGDLGAVEGHATALERWLALGGGDADARLEAAAAEAALEPGLLDRPLATLSGGQAARAGLAALRTARFDALLLDEPTNHLDAEGLAFLSRVLGEAAGGVVLVSHDRAVLAGFADELVELDGHTGRGTHYGGGWEAYERERDANRRRERAEYEHAVTRRTHVEEAEREVRRRAAASARNGAKAVRDGDKHGREWVKMRAEEAQSRARKIGTRAARVHVPDKPARGAATAPVAQPRRASRRPGGGARGRHPAAGRLRDGPGRPGRGARRPDRGPGPQRLGQVDAAGRPGRDPRARGRGPPLPGRRGDRRAGPAPRGAGPRRIGGRRRSAS